MVNDKCMLFLCFEQTLSSRDKIFRNWKDFFSVFRQRHMLMPPSGFMYTINKLIFPSLCFDIDPLIIRKSVNP